jgi:SEC-C motif domain protein
MKNSSCPCSSGKDYENCCQPFHKKYTYPPNALALMRSRYSAYAKNLTMYIIETTDPNGPAYFHNRQEWVKTIEQFSLQTKFEQLEILEFIDGISEAFVTFHAHLKQGFQDVSFIEKSRFVKKEGHWFYVLGHTCSPTTSREKLKNK